MKPARRRNAVGFSPLQRITDHLRRHTEMGAYRRRGEHWALQQQVEYSQGQCIRAGGALPVPLLGHCGKLRREPGSALGGAGE